MKEWYLKVRRRTEVICGPLELEDYSIQPSVDVSPPKWHLAHTTWFFEQFVLKAFVVDYKEFNSDFAYLFNSYYNNAGERVLRADRGMMTRPIVYEVLKYRQHVDKGMEAFLSLNPSKEQLDIIELGLNHEQQHQELLAYDIKYILGHQLTFPSYGSEFELKNSENGGFVAIKEGLYEIGYEGENFHFDNEEGRHKVYLYDFEIRKSLVTNGEWIAFIEAGGYENFNLWHSEGWDWVQSQETKAPMYWHYTKNEWHAYDMNGLKPLDFAKPVIHINLYEAYAYAEWKKMRLPTEAEWEVANMHFDWGQLWEWTNSSYLPYPGFKTAEGALGEYNGKFMVNQKVLKGGSVATPKGHTRKTYRNFFHPHLRWQFCGLRLVK
ncbi:MAG: sulfatase maturase [Bacteroidetes bacterium]|nr:MAG: sulfatase maturase [Bacteroidota bacterium]